MYFWWRVPLRYVLCVDVCVPAIPCAGGPDINMVYGMEYEQSCPTGSTLEDGTLTRTTVCTATGEWSAPIMDCEGNLRTH